MELKTAWEERKKAEKQIVDNQELLKSESDAEFAEILREDIVQLEKRVHELQLAIENLLVPPDPNDHRTTILELRAGTGGDEAALFVGDCVRMYKFYADQKGWSYELFPALLLKLEGLKNMLWSCRAQCLSLFAV